MFYQSLMSLEDLKVTTYLKQLSGIFPYPELCEELGVGV